MYTETFTQEGRTYTVRTEHDSDTSPLDGDGNGEDVTGWTTRDKRAGELVIAQDYPHKRFYDFAGACKKALAEGWDAVPCHAAFPGETRKQQAARAALANFNYLRRWFADEWAFVVVIVEDEDGNAQALGGVEDSDPAYIDEVAQELASQLAAEHEAAIFPVSCMGV
jgi:hypothetical protein